GDLGDQPVRPVGRGNGQEACRGYAEVDTRGGRGEWGGFVYGGVGGEDSGLVACPLSPALSREGRGLGRGGIFKNPSTPKPIQKQGTCMSQITCFKAYDIRGQLGTQLNEDIAYRIARAFAQWLKPRRIVLGGDIRESSAALKAALANGLRDEGVDVLDLGMVGTEEVYFATFHLEVDGGIEVTASHNPIDYNGFKLVREGSRPISADTGLAEIRALAEAQHYELVDGCDPSVDEQDRGSYELIDTRADYIEHLLTYIDPVSFTPMRLVVNAGNGAAGPVIDALEKAFAEQHMPVELVKICHKPDGTFPNGIPNPIRSENRGGTRDAGLKGQADMGIAWDGDFDRCFLFDEQGRFIEGYYIVGLLAEAFLQKERGARIIHDPRLVWNTVEQIEQNGGVAIQTKAGHAFIKERMRAEDAIYGGEMSAHHYFRDFAY